MKSNPEFFLHSTILLAPTLQNPFLNSIFIESALLFPSQGLPDLENEKVQRIVGEFGPLLERLKIDITDLDDRTARSRYTRARIKDKAVFETPYRVGTQTNWDSVRFSGRIVKTGYQNNSVILANILIGTRSDGSIWAPTESVPMPWKKDKTVQAPDPFTELNPDTVPRQIKYDQGLQGEEFTLITATGNLARYFVERKGRVRILDLAETPEALSDRSNWVSFTENNFSIVALSADGLLWHSGPYPMKGQPRKILPFLVPSSSKLRPVFDFKTGKAM